VVKHLTSSKESKVFEFFAKIKLGFAAIAATSCTAVDNK
jgi:hypothetical protein